MEILLEDSRAEGHVTDWREIPGNVDAFNKLKELLISGKAVGFVGAGASAGLYPLWPGLIERLADAAIRAGRADEEDKEIWQELDALEAGQQIRDCLQPGRFRDQIQCIFGSDPRKDGTLFTATHAALARLPFRAFVTTNYDPALTHALRQHRQEFEPQAFDWKDDRVSDWLKRRSPEAGTLPLLHAHGSSRGVSNVVFGAADFRTAYGETPYRRLFQSLWVQESLVVCGFGFTDPWLRIFTDLALSQADSRATGSPQHVGLIGLVDATPKKARRHRKAFESKYHLRPLFYPITEIKGPKGKTEREDHSALGPILEELIEAVQPQPESPTQSKAKRTPPSTNPLQTWFQQVAEEHRRLGDQFDRPVQLQLLEQAWVQVKVQPALADSEDPKCATDAKHGLLGQPIALDEVLKLPLGEPSWNTGRWLLEGPPGSGKTTLLRYLAMRLSKEGDAGCVPLFISLAALIDSKEDLLAHATDGLNQGGATYVQDALREAGAEGRLLIFLDGFDEVRKEKRKAAHKLLRHLKQDLAWSRCRMVISSRPIGRGESLDELPRLDLLPLEPKRQLEFLETWFKESGKENWKNEARAALGHLTGSPGLRKLSGIPLYLTLLSVLWDKGERPPGRLHLLYDRVFRLLLDGKHRREPNRMPAQLHVRSALAHLAYGMTTDDLAAEPIESLESRLRAPELKEIRETLQTVDEWKRDLYTFLQDVHERTQILGPHDGRRGDWRFWHRTFREALAAERLAAQHEGSDALVAWAQQLEEGGEGRWAEPLSLLAGRLEEADDLVLRLGEANSKLAVRAATIAQGLKPETIRKTLQRIDKLDERSQVYESIPDQLGDAEACLSLVEQLKEGQRNGFELYWLWWIVEEVERRWPNPRSRDLLARFFEHIPAPPAELFQTVETKDGGVELWREIPAGEGWVGSPKDEEGRYGDEGPRFRVKILQPYWLAAVPVTNEQYAAFDPGKAPYAWEGVSQKQLALHPRVNVTWYEAASFCRWLATLPGFANAAPRLPREEEWEVACRADSDTPYWSGKNEKDLDRVGWYGKNSGNRTHRVGRKEANPHGLFDLHGNVREWSASPWTSDYKEQAQQQPIPVDPASPPADLAGSPRGGRVVCGGWFWDTAQDCRSAYRDLWNPWVEVSVQGFRVLLSGPPSRS